MDFLKNMNSRVKKFSLLDIGLFKIAVIFGVLIVVKLIPQIMDINIWWFVVLTVICAIRPLYVFWIK